MRNDVWRADLALARDIAWQTCIRLLSKKKPPTKSQFDYWIDLVDRKRETYQACIAAALIGMEFGEQLRRFDHQFKKLNVQARVSAEHNAENVVAHMRSNLVAAGWTIGQSSDGSKVRA